MRAALVALLSVLLAAPTSAEPAHVERIELAQYGLYRGDRAGEIADAGTTTGTTTMLSNVAFYEATSRVPACRGVGFGVVYRPLGKPDGAGAALRVVWRLPEPGLRNPDNGITYRQSVSILVAPLGQARLRGYSFDHDWELVPGEWILEIWDGDRRLLAQTFSVYQASCPGLTSQLRWQPAAAAG